MGTITSGVGLISGINTSDLIDKLMAIEAQSQNLIKSRNTDLTKQQTAFQDLNAKLLVLKLSAGSFATNRLFQSSSVTSSNSNAVTGTAGPSATPGTYNFSVSRLVTTQQIVSQGYDSADSLVGAGTLTFSLTDTRLSSDTKLASLNGGAGVPRGKIRVTDASGASAIVDLSQALSVNDVVEAINNSSNINVTAAVNGDHFEITDNTTGVGTLTVANVGTTTTATALGLVSGAGGATYGSHLLTGAQVNKIASGTLLSALNDGNGVRFNASGVNDFTVTRRDGTTFDVDIGTATTVGGAITAINAASGGTVTASLSSDGVGITLTDSTGGGGNLSVADINSSLAAQDLGLVNSVASNTLTGGRVISAINSRLLNSLNGGYRGVGDTALTTGTVNVNGTDINLSSARSISEVITGINAQSATTNVTATINQAGNGITLTHATGGAFTVSDTSGNLAAFLNVAGASTNGAISSGSLNLQTVSRSTLLSSLNQGKGIGSGLIRVTDGNGVSSLVDLTTSHVTTIGDAIDAINATGLAVTARVNNTGDGIVVENTAGSGSVVITDDGSTTAAKDLGLSTATPGVDGSLDGRLIKQLTVDADDTITTLAQAINDAGIGIKASVFNDGSTTGGYRLSLLSTASGRAGSFVLDSGATSLQGSTLVEGKDAVVFYGSSDPAKGIAVTSASNSLTSLIPGVTINLLSTTTSPVQLTIARDDKAVTDQISRFVTDFNNVLDTINKYDKYDPDTQIKGVLLGDSTLAQVRNSLYRYINGNNNDLTGKYVNLSQVGIKVISGGRLSFDSSKFATASADDRDAVADLFAYKKTETDASTGKVSITASGTLVKIDTLLNNLTDTVDGAVPRRVDSIGTLITQNEKTIASMQVRLDAKKQILQFKFAAMETALASMQQQSNALAGFANSVNNSSSSSSG